MMSLRTRMKADVVKCCIVLLLVVIQSTTSFSPRFSTTCLSAVASSSSSSHDEDWISKKLDEIVVEESSSSSFSSSIPSVNRRRPVIRRTDAMSLERQEHAQEEIVQARQRQETAQQDPNLLSNMSFDQVLLMSDNSKQHSAALIPLLRALQQDFGQHAKMTRIQAATYGPARNGYSILARARTGTGKTLAFLVPLVERLLLDNYTGQGFQQCSIGILIVVPTRELAIQIADTATRLVQYTSPRILVQTVHGGTNIQRHVRMLATNPSISGSNSGRSQMPSILVATPGRLLDLMKERIRGSITFQQVLSLTPMLVLDEADFLVHGFYRETQKILQVLPRKDKRQTLLFSATTPRRVQRLLRNVADSSSSSNGNNNNNNNSVDDTSKDYIEILDVDNDPQYSSSSSSSLQKVTSPSSTSKQQQQRQEEQHRVQESYIILPDMKFYVSALLALVDRAVQQEQQVNSGGGGSIIIFFPTTRLVKFFATLFQQRQQQQKGHQKRNADVVILEMHSQMSPSARQRVSAAFRQQENDPQSSASSRGGHGSGVNGGGPIKILFTSDVSARGLDYPNVNLVIQYGLPSSRDLYVHRIGRTARSGNQGRGLLVALPFEQVSHVVPVVKKSGRKKSSSSPPPTQSSIVHDEELTRLVESSLYDWSEELESIQKQVKDAAAAVSMTDSSNGGGGSGRYRPSRKNAAQSAYSPLGPTALAAYSSFVAYYVEHAPRRGVSMSEIRQASEAFGRDALGLVHLPELPTSLADKLGARD